MCAGLGIACLYDVRVAHSAKINISRELSRSAICTNPARCTRGYMQKREENAAATPPPPCCHCARRHPPPLTPMQCPSPWKKILTTKRGAGGWNLRQTIGCRRRRPWARKRHWDEADANQRCHFQAADGREKNGEFRRGELIVAFWQGERTLRPTTVLPTPVLPSSSVPELSLLLILLRWACLEEAFSCSSILMLSLYFALKITVSRCEPF